MTLTMNAYSAPGKALVAGGYLVLFPEFTAFSVALSARVHAVLGAEQVEGLVVESPQFGQKWHYGFDGKDHSASANPFLAAVASVVGQAWPNPKGAHITIWSDNGFHSQPEGTTAQFTMHKKPISQVPKTGLGSSAALTVAVVGALVRAQTGGQGPLSTDELNLVHNLSQVAHSLAQGKTGSGFDVATAVYGSINYSRFSGDLLSTHPDFEARWDQKVEPVKLPGSIKVLLGDVKAGSETPSMVRTVLQWRKDSPAEAEQLWSELNKANLGLARAIESGSLEDVPSAFSAVRSHLQTMTKATGVPIEPIEQTQLLDACTQIEGVLGGVVPGAGGHDAVCVLVETAKLEGALSALQKLPNVSWLALEEDPQGLVCSVDPTSS